MATAPKKSIKKKCPAGHFFFKSSDCPVCPVCEQLRKPGTGFLAALAAPARRALEAKHITTVQQLAKYTAEEILALHGIGPSAIPLLQQALRQAGLHFKTKKRN